MRLVVGLGNPGREYERTRHNIGFMVVDEVARNLGAPAWKRKHEAQETRVNAQDVLLAKPLTYMNESGRAVQRIAAWHKISAPGVLVVSDDLDLPFGRLRMRASGSSGGHNGLKDVIAYLGDGFPRLRIGIGRADEGAIAHVLMPFDENEGTALPHIIEMAASGVLTWLQNDPLRAIQAVNGWRLDSPPG